MSIKINELLAYLPMKNFKTLDNKKQQKTLTEIYEFNTKIFPETVEDIEKFEQKYGSTLQEINQGERDLSGIFESEAWKENVKIKTYVKFAMAARFGDSGDRTEQEATINKLIDQYETEK